MVQIHFINIKEVTISYGRLGLHEQQFNFNKFIDNKPGTYSMESVQACNPSNEDRLTN